MAKSPIELANEKVALVDVLKILGVDPGFGRYEVAKSNCPFEEIYHSDGGMKKAFMVHGDTNTAWCFAGCGFFTPVKLWSEAKELPQKEAAKELLLQFQINDFDIDARWAAALAGNEPYVDPSSLAEALKIFCQRIAPDWEVRQFEEDVSTMLDRCFRLLPNVVTDEQAEQWLSVTKQAMQKQLGVQHADQTN